MLSYRTLVQLAQCCWFLHESSCVFNGSFCVLVVELIRYNTPNTINKGFKKRAFIRNEGSDNTSRIKTGLMLMTPVQLDRQDTELVVSHKILFQVYEQ